MSEWKKVYYGVKHDNGIYMESIEVKKYKVGQSLDGIEVSPDINPNDGGYIARNIDNPDDMWFISQFDIGCVSDLSLASEARELRSFTVDGETPIKAFAIDEKGPGGANHEYSIRNEQLIELSWIKFQKGTVPQSGVNGVTNEALLAIVRDRLESFQEGSNPCIENAEALKAINTAIKQLNARTKRRISYNIEGKVNI